MKDLTIPVYVLDQGTNPPCVHIYHIPVEIVDKVRVIMHSCAVLWLLSHRLCQGTVINSQNKLAYLSPISCVWDCFAHRDKVFTAAVFQHVWTFKGKCINFISHFDKRRQKIEV